MTGDPAGAVPCAGGIVLDSRGRLLVVQRRTPPSAGLWSIPGGRCLPGEPAEAACVREVAEETGIVVTVLRLAGSVVLDAPGGGSYLVKDFVCAAVSGEPVAGDDARQARWVSRAELEALPTTPGLLEALASWGALPD